MNENEETFKDWVESIICWKNCKHYEETDLDLTYYCSAIGSFTKLKKECSLYEEITK